MGKELGFVPRKEIMAQKVKEMVSEEIIDESTVKKEVEEAKKHLDQEKAESSDAPTEKSEAGVPTESVGKKKTTAKKPRKPVRSKNYLAAYALIDQNKVYEIDEAIAKVLETTTVKFDPTIEVHALLAISSVRGAIVLPAGTPKEKRLAVADEKTADEIIAKVKAGKIDFDILLATPSAMPKLAASAKILGPRGLMPSPKSGTVVEDVVAAAQEIKSKKYPPGNCQGFVG